MRFNNMKKLLGEYKAEVIDNNDSKNLNRVKIRIKGIMDGIPKEYLPWASYKSPSPSVKGGSYIKPDVGAKVWVRFADWDINNPFYSGGVVETSDDLSDRVEDDRYIIYETPDGNVLALHDDLNDMEFKLGTYNSTMRTFIDLFLAHGHMYISPLIPSGVVPSGKPDLIYPGVPPPTAQTILNFRTGSL